MDLESFCQLTLFTSPLLHGQLLVLHLFLRERWRLLLLLLLLLHLNLLIPVLLGHLLEVDLELGVEHAFHVLVAHVANLEAHRRQQRVQDVVAGAAQGNGMREEENQQQRRSSARETQ